MPSRPGRAITERLQTATLVLLQLPYDDAFIAELVEQMTTLDLDKSPLFEAISNRVVLAHARKTIVRLGTQRFGAPSAEIETRLRNVADVTQLDAIEDRLLSAANWEDLLAGAP